MYAVILLGHCIAEVHTKKHMSEFDTDYGNEQGRLADRTGSGGGMWDLQDGHAAWHLVYFTYMEKYTRSFMFTFEMLAIRYVFLCQVQAEQHVSV